MHVEPNCPPMQPSSPFRASRVRRSGSVGRAMLVLGVGTLLACLPGPGPFLSIRAVLQVLWLLPLWALGLYMLHRRGLLRWHKRDAPQWALFATLMFSLVSSIAHAPAYFYLKWLPVGGWSPGWSGLERTLLLAGLFLLLRQWRPSWTRRILLMALLLLQVGAWIALMRESGGDPLYRVDHPSFFYRFWSWGQMAPRFIYYDPHWNGGYVAPYLIASGVLAPGLFLWPVWRFFDTSLVYTPAIGFLFLGIVPAIAALSLKAVTRDRTAWILAAILSLGTSHHTYIHLIHYGTFGSVFAASFLLPVTACLYRLVVMGRRDAGTWLGLFATSAMALCWPPVAFMAVPIALALLMNAKRFTPGLIWGGLLVGLGLALWCLVPVLSLLSHSKVSAFIGTQNSLWDPALMWNARDELGELLRRSHPVLLFAGCVGLLAVPHRRWRWFFGPILLASLCLAALGKEWKPLLQLDRIWIEALYVAILPAALIVARLLRQRTAIAQLFSALLCGLILMGGYTTVKYFGNEGRARYNVMSPEIHAMVDWIKENVPEDGRLLFGGPAVHGYGGGKVAALPLYTDREMMACDFYGFSPKLVEYNYPPREFRKYGPEKLMQFMDLYNVTHIATYHNFMKEALGKWPDQYEEVWHIGDRTIFQVHRTSSLFLQGKGRIEAALNQVDVFPANPEEAMVIKYNWTDGLSCEPGGARIEPFDTGTSVTLIRVEPNGAERVRISYRKWY